MPWKIAIVNNAPRENEINNKKTQWATWFYSYVGRCWYMNVDNGVAGDANNSRPSATSPMMDTSYQIALESDPTNNFKDCFQKDKSLELNILFCDHMGYPIFRHIIKFAVKGGGMFSDYKYYVNDKEVALSTYESQKLDTIIKIIDNTQIDISTTVIP